MGLRLETIVDSIDKVFGCTAIDRSVLTVERRKSEVDRASSPSIPSLVDKRGLEGKGVVVGPAPEAVVINAGGFFRLIEVEVQSSVVGVSVDPFTIEASEDGVNFTLLDPAVASQSEYANKSVFVPTPGNDGRIAIRSIHSLGRYFRVSQLAGVSAQPQSLVIELRGVYINIPLGALLPDLISLTVVGDEAPATIPGNELVEAFSLSFSRNQESKLGIQGSAGRSSIRGSTPKTIPSRSSSERDLFGLLQGKPFTVTVDVGAGCQVDAVMLEGGTNESGLHGYVTKALIRRVGVDAVPVTVNSKDGLLKLVRLPGLGACSKVEIEVQAWHNWPGLKFELFGRRSSAHTDMIASKLSSASLIPADSKPAGTIQPAPKKSQTSAFSVDESSLKRSRSNPETMSNPNLDKWVSLSQKQQNKSLKTSWWKKLFCLTPQRSKVEVQAYSATNISKVK